MLAVVVALTAMIYSVDLFAQTRAVRLTRYQGDALSGISVSGGFKVELSQGSATSAVVEVNEELEKYLIFENKNGIINIGLNFSTNEAQSVINRLHRHTRPHLVARVVVSDIAAVSASGGSAVSVNTPVDVSQFSLNVSSSSKVNGLGVRAKEAAIKLSNGSSVEMGSVNTTRLDVSVSSSSKLHMGDVVSGEMTVGASNGSAVNTGSVSADAMAVRASSSSRMSFSGVQSNDMTLNASNGSSVETGAVKTVGLALGMSSSSRLRAEGIEADNMTANASNGSTITIERISLDKANVNASSSSRISVSGTIGELVSSFSNGSRLNGESLNTNRTTVNASSSSSVVLAVRDTLSLSVSNGSSLTYYGSPAVIGNRVSSGGRVSQYSGR